MTSLTERLTNYSDPNSFGSRMRRRRSAALVHLIDQVVAEKGHARILDLGGTASYWNILPADYLQSGKVRITLVNLPGEHHATSNDQFTYVEGTACDLPQFADQSFDIVHSNSVIEHVGSWENMRAFARECQRLGEHYFVQTPNFWFPIEPHFMAPFVHWLPLPLHAWLMTRMSLGQYRRYDSLSEAVAAVQGVRLLDRGMMMSLFPKADIRRERFMLLTKSMTAVSPEASPASHAH